MLPQSTDEYDVRVTQIAVMPKGGQLFSETVTLISIDDEAAGEFVKVTQDGGHTDMSKWITIDVKEWPVLCDAIEFMVGQCRAT